MENVNLEQRISLLEERLNKIESKLLDTGTESSGQLMTIKKMSIKEFLMTKTLDDDVKRTLAISYFIEHVENTKPFTAADLKKAFRLAKIKLPSNINDKINMNIRAGRIMEAEEKKESKKAWELTATGEVFVEKELKSPMKNILKPGEITQKSGQYEIIGQRGGKTGKEITSVKGKPLPPTPKAGSFYKLVDPTKH